ncbi:hypothetical protein GLOTRDRAFT_38263, partial [Gloeophyllum trabeum ATCC 11539]
IVPFGVTYEKIGTIQRRLAWPLHKDDTLTQSGSSTELNIYAVFPYELSCLDTSHFTAVEPSFRLSYLLIFPFPSVPLQVEMMPQNPQSGVHPTRCTELSIIASHDESNVHDTASER